MSCSLGIILYFVLVTAFIWFVWFMWRFISKELDKAPWIYELKIMRGFYNWETVLETRSASLVEKYKAQFPGERFEVRIKPL